MQPVVISEGGIPVFLGIPGIPGSWDPWVATRRAEGSKGPLGLSGLAYRLPVAHLSYPPHLLEGSV